MYCSNRTTCSCTERGIVGPELLVAVLNEALNEAALTLGTELHGVQNFLLLLLPLNLTN